jgi:hypothetical protein
MLEVSEEITAFLLANVAFTTVMATRISPLVAKEGTPFPFTTYAVSEEPLSNDGDETMITLFFWFDRESFKKCASFTSVVKNIIRNKYDWMSSSIELNEDSLGFVGIINLKKQ